ncbi:transcription factor Adf-1-like [Schistocerca cancellata]|uniref:transcription factor Adf-1-like n=1 Tax=Schistocerca cancellata TaxID=274614 RepID=UPI002117FBF0|nr:transcription factor Adf-1-like [Schistocerca cancellata]
MTSWSKQNTLHFIEAVRRHPCIWDVKLGDYKNTQKRYDEWEEIAKAFNVSRKECEDKWHNLKSQYSRELAKRKSSKGTGSATSNVYHSSWYAFESMQFIRDNYKPLSHRITHVVVPVSKLVILLIIYLATFFRANALHNVNIYNFTEKHDSPYCYGLKS